MPKIHSLFVVGLHRHRLLSSEFTCAYSVKVPERTNGRESSEELGHTIVLRLPWVHPNTTKQIVAHCYLLRAPVKAIDDKFDSAPAGLGFRRRGAPERRNGTKRYHVYTSVIWVVDGKYSLTLCVGASPTSTSLSRVYMHY